MKVFLSWSGIRSHEVAKAFATFLPLVIQKLDPFISSDIDKGAVWVEEITQELKDSANGIICLTAENKAAPWILFETGALAKGLTRNRVRTFLIDIEPREIGSPLSQFQSTSFNDVDVFKLVSSLNASLSNTDRLPDSRLRAAFDAFWPNFEKEFKAALTKAPASSTPARKPDEVMGEILQTVRGIERKLATKSMEEKLRNSIIGRSFTNPEGVTVSNGSGAFVISPTETPHPSSLLRANLGGSYVIGPTSGLFTTDDSLKADGFTGPGGLG